MINETEIKFDKQLNSVIAGALKEVIKVHGPITKTFIGSASKRVMADVIGQFGKTLTLKAMQSIIDDKHYVVVDRKEYKRLTEGYYKKCDIVRNLVSKLKEHDLL